MVHTHKNRVTIATHKNPKPKLEIKSKIYADGFMGSIYIYEKVFTSLKVSFFTSNSDFNSVLNK